MNIYHVNTDIDRFKFFATKALGQMDQILFSPPGQKLGAAWKGLTIFNIDPSVEDYPGELPIGDFVGISTNAIGVTGKASGMVGDALRYCGELLPVNCPDLPQPLWWFHPTSLIDALDVAHSDAKVLAESGRLFVTRYAFFADRLADAVIFKVPQSPGSTFCTEAFKSLVEKHGLTGLAFRLAWSNESAAQEHLSGGCT